MEGSTRYIIVRRPGDCRKADDGGLAMAGEGDGGNIEVTVENLPNAAIGDLDHDPEILTSAPDMPIELVAPASTAADDDVDADGNAWGIAATGALQSSFDGRGVRVAVLDTGMETAHPAFAGLRPTSMDFTGTSETDGHGHGTHCAGTIFGRDVGGRIGIARGVTDVMVGKVLDDVGRGSAASLVKAMIWAMDGGADVISMSVGFAPGAMAAKLIKDGWPEQAAWSQALQSFAANLRTFDTLMELNRRNGVPRSLVIAAAGNDSKRDVDTRYVVAASMPSAAKDVVSVAALRRTPAGLVAADFSNIKSTLAAPGHSIRSAWKGGTMKTKNGTSMACPHVAGLAALWWQSLGARASAEMVRSKLIGQTNVASLAPGHTVTDVGYGLSIAP